MENISKKESTINGKKLQTFLLKNSRETVVKITNYGAIIMSIKLKTDGGTYNDIVLGFDEPEQYLSSEYLSNYPYYGAAIGRYANRIKKSIIHIDGQTYHLNGQNEDFILHGGHEGFDKKFWDVVSSENDRLVLQYISLDGEEGFPGALAVMITFELTDDDELSYEYIATVNKATAINLTHHSYFNLNNGIGMIDENHHLRIHASRYLEQDETSCSTGVIKDVEGTRYDFREYQQTGKIAQPEKGIDISYLFDNPGIDNIAAEAWCDGRKIKLEVRTTLPVLHLYNAYASPTLIGKGGTQYTPFSAFCFETQVHPNAINIPDFPNTILRPGEVYQVKTVYRFCTNNELLL